MESKGGSGRCSGCSGGGRVEMECGDEVESGQRERAGDGGCCGCGERYDGIAGMRREKVGTGG